MMWNDGNDGFSNLIISVEEDKNFPITCPICGQESVHIYMHRFSDDSPRGGAWIWCSECKTFTHFQYRIPDWWKNLERIDFDSLQSNPSYLEDNKSLIDDWINSISR